MPTYQYACTECGHGFEAVQSFTDAALTDCPKCQGRLRKVFNSVGIVFKGSGFYRTDSREKAPAGAKGGGGKKEKATGSADSSDSSGSSGDGKKAEPKGDGKAGAGASSSTGSSTTGSAA